MIYIALKGLIMTLVVARQVNDEVYIVGDTKFTEVPGSILSESKKYIGGLKVVLLAPGICVGFSGNVEIARNAIQGVYDKGVNLFEKNHAIDYFFEHHRYSMEKDPDNATDFIIAVIVERNEKPGTFLKEIFRIADLKVSWENESTYIGSNDGFNSFQESFHHGSQHHGSQKSEATTFLIMRLGAIGRPGFDQSLSAARRAMQDVIDNPNMLNVDGYCTVVVSEENQFRCFDRVMTVW